MKDKTAPVLEVHNLRKTWPAGPLAVDITGLQLGPGEVVLVLGDNGAGKTTLLRLLAGLLPADADAKLFWQGKQVNSLRPGRDVTYLHQQPRLWARSVRANVVYVLRLHNRPPADADAILAWAGLSAVADQYADQLSGGQERRLALARVHATAAPLVLLDEPTTHLDATGVSAVEAMVHDMAAAGRTVVAAFQKNSQPAGLREARSLVLTAGQIVPA